MKTLIIRSHPWENSYNRAIEKAVTDGLVESERAFEVIDLPGDNFNPMLSSEDLSLYSKGDHADPLVGRYQEEIAEADSLIIIFPLWWGNLPPNLKGFFDKVFLRGFAYKDDPFPGHGLLKKKKATVIITMQSPKIFFNLITGPALRNIFIMQTLKLCGFGKVRVCPLGRIKSVTDKKRKKWLDSFYRKARAGKL